MDKRGPLDKELFLLTSENIRVVKEKRNEKLLITSRRWPWKAKTRVMLACSVIALGLFVMAAYLINSFVEQTRGKEKQNLIAEEIDNSLSFPSCGNRSTRACVTGSLCLSRSKRLIGGSASPSNSWPWMAEIIYEEKHYCGAVLISLNVLLTAAHCMFHDGDRLYPNDLQVRLGSKYRLSKDDEVQSFKVSQIFVHNSFKLSSLENDIAVITLDRHVTPTISVWPICISGHEDIKAGTNAVMTGWGKTSHEGSFSSILREAIVPVVPMKKCMKANKELFNGVSVNQENNICAGYGKLRPEYGCNGDSGGPLMVESSSQRWTIIGIMSWGGPTCSALKTNSFTVFTKLKPYKTWIEDIAKILK